MNRQAIVTAIETQNYDQLLSVFKTHATDKRFMPYFEDGVNNRTSLHANMLVDKVKTILRILEQNKYFETAEEALPAIAVKETPKKASKSAEKPKITKNPHINYDDLSDEMKALYDANTRTNGEMKSLHAAMRAAQTDERRAELRKDLDAMEEALQANWALIDAWYATKDDEPLPQSTPSVAELSRKIDAAKRYIQRFDVKDYQLDEKQQTKMAEYKVFLTGMGVSWEKKKKKQAPCDKPECVDCKANECKCIVDELS